MGGSGGGLNFKIQNPNHKTNRKYSKDNPDHGQKPHCEFRKRSLTMGDKGGKKNKEKGRKQKANKQAQEAQRMKEKQQKNPQ